MANILYRSGASGTTTFTIPSTNGSVARALTNAEIDGNFYSLDQAKFEKSGGTISGATTINGDLTIGSNGNVSIAGNLTVGGTTTTINSTILNVDDINIELGAVANPTDATANGGGITLLGTSNKTIIWDSTNANWTSNQDWNIPTGKVFKINNTSVLSATTLGSGIINSSLTKIGLTSAGYVKSDASGNLSVEASIGAGNLTGATLASGVTSSSLTKLGTSAGYVKSDASGNLSVDNSTFSLSSHGHYIGTTAVQATSAAQAVSGVSSLTNAAGSDLTITTSNNAGVTGALYLLTGTASSGNTDAGSLNITTGNGNGSGDGGAINITSGNGGASANGNGGSISIISGSGTTAAGNIIIRSGNGVASGSINIYAGNSTYAASGFAGDLSLSGGTSTGSGAQAGMVYIRGGANTHATSGVGGDVYIDGGSGPTTRGSVYIGSSASNSVSIGSSSNTTTVAGTVKLPNVGTSGFVKLGAGGQLSADTNTYLTSYTETSNLSAVTGRGASTTSACTFSGGLSTTGITVSKSGTDSLITFPAQTNDPGYIKHYESNNTAVMYFSVSDDAGANDYFSFGNTSGSGGAFVEGLRITASGVVSVGTWQASSISTTYTDAKITSITANAPISRDSSTGAVTISHNTSGVTAGTYNNVTVNTYGHVTGGSNTAYLTGESDSLATVTGRGNSTGTACTFSGGVQLDGSVLKLRSNTWTISSTSSSVTSPVSGYAAGHGSAGIFIDVSNIGDNGGIYIGEDACTIWNAADSGYLFRIIEEDEWQTTGATFATSTGTDPGYAIANGVKFVVDGAGNVKNAGSITASGNVTAYSDVRLKTNIKTIENALDTTLKLRGVTFQKDGKDGIGVIAQEIKEVLPELVLEADDKQKTLSVAYGNIVGVLIEAIKELNAKVEDLQNQLANK